MSYCFKEIRQLLEAIVSHTTLPAKVVVVCWNELVERHTALWVVLQEVHNFQGKLLGLLNLFWCLICNEEFPFSISTCAGGQETTIPASNIQTYDIISSKA